jgi:diguanylate cyclase (GGDEF)-like protein/PAS domain S-box-containing protein
MSEGRFSSFLDRAPIPVAVLDCHFRFLKVNQWMAELHGISAESHLGKTIGELFPDIAPVTDPILRQVLATGESVQIEVTGRPPIPQEGARHWMMSYVPVTENSEIVMIAFDITERKKADEEREAFRNQALRDPLTDLYNRRYLEESLNRELRRAVRQKRSFGVMMIDIDHFKLFNDRYGHAAGDLLLKKLGAFVASRVRAEDIVCRYGGDEFSLVLTDAAAKDLVKRAENLCSATRQFTMQWQGKSMSGITASIGVAVFPDHGSTADELIKAADDALYAAKSDGRDRIRAAECNRSRSRPSAVGF